MVFCVVKEKTDIDKWVIRSVHLPNFQKDGEGGRGGDGEERGGRLDRISLLEGNCWERGGDLFQGEF